MFGNFLCLKVVLRVEHSARLGKKGVKQGAHAPGPVEKMWLFTS